MTRLDANSEPSMEDILASIRKIIAEEPPSPRLNAAPLGQANPSAMQSSPSSMSSSTTPSTSRLSGRDTFFPMSSRFDPAPAAQPEIFAKPVELEPRQPDQASQATALQKVDVQPFAAERPSSARLEPSFAALGQSVAPAQTASPAPQTLSVDAQLSDLLDDALPEAATPTAGSVDDALDRLAPVAPANAEAVQTASAESAAVAGGGQPAPRAKFTLSRDGFLPAGDTSEAAERDPFEFDLGPSPFDVKPGVGSASANPAPNSPFDLGGVVPSRSIGPAESARVASAPSNELAPAGAPPDAAAAAPVSEPAPSAAIAAPSVAATLAPRAEAAAVSAPEPVSRFIPANAGMDTARPVERDVIEVVPRAPHMATVVEPDAHAIGGAAVPSVQASHAYQQRTMEDTVAELLRPMLKAWLAENMPRIVERALRREMSEQLHLDNKTAAE